MQERNEHILSLLETTQEYLRNMSSLQSSLVDGYIEIAQIKKTSFGIPYSSIPISEDTRKIFTNNKQIEDAPEIGLIPGVSPYSVEKVQKCFEAALQEAIRSAVILGQINEKYDVLKDEISQ